jgi:hypothetical protein
MQRCSINISVKDLTVTPNQFDSQGFWHCAVLDPVAPTADMVDLFDQNGYDLTELERMYASANMTATASHRSHRTAIKQAWFVQSPKLEGAILNHSLLFERKGYAGPALVQLRTWSNLIPRFNQLTALRPKWGLDFSMDYVDRAGNAFEVLHWEYDGFDLAEIQQVKQQVEPVLLAIDWDEAAGQILARKSEWHGLDFFAQSAWKCCYFGIVNERFKMVAWK